MEEDELTVYCGNLSSEIDEEILYELFLQVAPLKKVRIPTDKNGKKGPFGFVTFKHLESVEYAIHIMNGTKLFDKNIIVRQRNNNKEQQNSPSQQKRTQQVDFDQLMKMGNQMLVTNEGINKNYNNNWKHREREEKRNYRYGRQGSNDYRNNRHNRYDNDHYTNFKGNSYGRRRY